MEIVEMLQIKRHNHIFDGEGRIRFILYYLCNAANAVQDAVEDAVEAASTINTIK